MRENASLYVLRAQGISARVFRVIGGPKVTCAVSKRVASTAVRRNSLKRACREAARCHLHLLPESAGVVISVRTALSDDLLIMEEIKSLFGEIAHRAASKSKVQ